MACSKKRHRVYNEVENKVTEFEAVTDSDDGGHTERGVLPLSSILSA
jgi:hypothetical protein